MRVNPARRKSCCRWCTTSSAASPARGSLTSPGQTLQATALVHEAWLRLVGGGQGSGFGVQEKSPKSKVQGPRSKVQEATGDWAREAKKWDSRGHFFASAAEAMRRILVEAARRKQNKKDGGRMVRCEVDLDGVVVGESQEPLVVLSVHEALDRLAEKSPRKAELVKLRYFLGCTMAEAAEILGIAAATAEEDWTYARTWLRREWLRGQEESKN